MPPVYTAFFMWVASAVLWWSGWREETAEGIPDRFVAVFLSGWPIAASKNTVFGPFIEVNGAFAWTGFAMLMLACRIDKPTGWAALSSGLLCGSIEIWAARSPWLWPMSAEWVSQAGSAAAAGVLAAMLVKGAAGQLVAVTVALALLEGFEAAWAPGSGRHLIGSPAWMQSWWVSALAARLSAVAGGIVSRRLPQPAWRRGDEGS